MSVIVRGMEMPKRCYTCPMNVSVHNDTEWCCNQTGDSVTESEEFVELRNGVRCLRSRTGGRYEEGE